MKIAAFDLSLTATGYAVYPMVNANTDPPIGFGTFAPEGLTKMRKLQGKPPLSGMARLRWLRDSVLSIAEHADSVIFEGLSFGSNDPSAQERSGLAYLIRFALWERGQKFILVAPTSLKKFVTGKGNADKNIVIREVFRRWDLTADNDNEADAISLAQIGRCLAGDMTPETEAQKEVIEAILNPKVKVPKKRRVA